jgi:hypothetical protein
LKAGDGTELKKSDWRKGLVGALGERALIDNGWLGTRLHMGARNAVSRIIRAAREMEKNTGYADWQDGADFREFFPKIL